MMNLFEGFAVRAAGAEAPPYRCWKSTPVVRDAGRGRPAWSEGDDPVLSDDQGQRGNRNSAEPYDSASRCRRTAPGCSVKLSAPSYL